MFCGVPDDFLGQQSQFHFFSDPEQRGWSGKRANGEAVQVKWIEEDRRGRGCQRDDHTFSKRSTDKARLEKESDRNKYKCLTYLLTFYRQLLEFPEITSDMKMCSHM